MEDNNFKIEKLKESCHAKQIRQVVNQSLYCEIQYQRDRSSFAGMAFDITCDKGIVIVMDEELIKNLDENIDKIICLS